MVAAVSMILAECDAFTFKDAQQIQQLLKERKFSTLEELLTKAEKDYQEDLSKEQESFLTWKSFSFAQTNHEQYYNDWVKERPQSPYAHVARAAFYRDIGWAYRGVRAARNTTSEQFSRMEYYHKKAYEDVLKAFQLKPRFIFAYYVLLGLTPGDIHDMKSSLNEALTFHPYSYFVRSAYLMWVVPRWGGSMEELKAFIGTLRPYYDKNPRLRVLEGRLPIEMGDELYSERKHTEALAYYTEALTFGESSLAYYQHGRNLTAMGRHADAIKSYDKSLERDPLQEYALVGRARSYHALNDDQQAINDLTVALELNSFEVDALDLRGLIYCTQEQYEKALSDFQHAATLNPASSKYQRTINSIRKKMAEANK